MIQPHETSPLLIAAPFNNDTNNSVGGFKRISIWSWKFALLLTVSSFVTVYLRNDIRTHQHRAIVQALVDLNGTLDGEIFFHFQNNGFEDAARIWNAQVQAPLAVIEVHSERDVQRTLPVLSNLGNVHGFPFRIRSGGHHKAGYSSVAGGAVLSLVKMNTITFLDKEQFNENDTTSLVAKFGPAVRVRHVLEQVLVPHGYAGVVGACRDVAESGFILGGGFGFQSRMYGLGADNVERMRVVLVNGSVVEASPTQHEDLFFALRGAGGGNFGVVTEIQYHLYKAQDTQLAAVVNELDYMEIAMFLQKLGDMELPDELVVMFDNVVGTAQTPEVNLLWFGNNNTQGIAYIESVIIPIVPYANVTMVPLSWSGMTESQPSGVDNETTPSTDDDGAGANFASNWEHPYAQAWSGFLFSDNNTVSAWTDMMSIIEKLLKNCPYLLPDIELWGGAISRVPWNTTAFPYRKAIYNVGVLLMVPPNDLDGYHKQVKEVNAWWPRVSQYLTGTYNNYPMESLGKEEYARAYWGDNLDRLMEIKQQYDPTNVMSFEQSIPVARR